MNIMYKYLMIVVLLVSLGSCKKMARSAAAGWHYQG